MIQNINSIFDTLWWLANYPHIIGLSQELKGESSFKRFFYNIPLLILRDKENCVHVYLDVCPHKRAPLVWTINEIYCSYHWWKFELSWDIKSIPSSPCLEKKLKCKLHSIKAEEKYWFIWIFPNLETSHSIPEVFSSMNGNWKHLYKEAIFDTPDDLLIENFMDSTHTPIVHNWIIRSNKTKTKHTIHVIQKQNTITAAFEETYENVWLWMNYLMGNQLKISHTDTFLPPNLIQVNYTINGIHRFQAFIWCNSSQEGKSHGFFLLSYNFGTILNFLLKFILPFFTRIVIRQDFNITKSQYKNHKYFWKILECHIDYDLLHTKVKILKQKIKDNLDTKEESSENTINIFI